MRMSRGKPLQAQGKWRKAQRKGNKGEGKKSENNGNVTGARSTRTLRSKANGFRPSSLGIRKEWKSVAKTDLIRIVQRKSSLGWGGEYRDQRWRGHLGGLAERERIPVNEHAERGSSGVETWSRGHIRGSDSFYWGWCIKIVLDDLWVTRRVSKNGSRFRKDEMTSSVLDTSMIILFHRIMSYTSLNPQFLAKCGCWIKLECYLTSRLLHVKMSSGQLEIRQYTIFSLHSVWYIVYT